MTIHPFHSVVWTTVWLVLCTVPSTAFLFTQPRHLAKSGLDKISQARIGQVLDLRLELASLQDLSSRIMVSGLSLRLDSTRDTKRVHMPGADGNEPHVCSPARELAILQQGHFVDLNGLQEALVNECAWEIAWRKGSNHGQIICGLNLPKELVRNEARVEKGPIYINFAIWNEQDFVEAHEEKKRVKAQAEIFMRDQQETMKRYKEETNLFQKARLYHAAATAADNYLSSGLDRFKTLPNRKDLVPLENDNNPNDKSESGDFMIAKTGVIWTAVQEPGTFGGTSKNVVLGHAYLQQPKKGPLSGYHP